MITRPPTSTMMAAGCGRGRRREASRGVGETRERRKTGRWRREAWVLGGLVLPTTGDRGVHATCLVEGTADDRGPRTARNVFRASDYHARKIAGTSNLPPPTDAYGPLALPPIPPLTEDALPLATLLMPPLTAEPRALAVF